MVQWYVKLSGLCLDHYDEISLCGGADSIQTFAGLPYDGLEARWGDSDCPLHAMMQHEGRVDHEQVFTHLDKTTKTNEANGADPTAGMSDVAKVCWGFYNLVGGTPELHKEQYIYVMNQWWLITFPLRQLPVSTWVIGK